MAELKCGAKQCLYNRESLCSKGDICVGGRHAETAGGTCCESFAGKRGEMDTFTNSIYHPSTRVSIDCEAVKCIYNKNYRCLADHVEIRGAGAKDHTETVCETFSVEKQ